MTWKGGAIGICALGLLAALAACSDQTSLEVIQGKPVTYQCNKEKRIVATYCELSDHSLEFVRLRLPDGTLQTLPHVASASGARYTDDFQYVWWTKGDRGFLETRDAQGQWQMRYDNCQEQRTLE